MQLFSGAASWTRIKSLNEMREPQGADLEMTSEESNGVPASLPRTGISGSPPTWSQDLNSLSTPRKQMISKTCSERAVGCTGTDQSLLRALYPQPLRLHLPGLLAGFRGIHLPAAPQVHIARLAILAPAHEYIPLDSWL